MQFVRAYYFFLELSVCSNVASSVRQGQAKPDSSPHLRPKGLHSARGRINFGRYARLQRAISSIIMDGVFVNTRCSLVPFEKSSIFSTSRFCVPWHSRGDDFNSKEQTLFNHPPVLPVVIQQPTAGRHAR